MSKIKVGEFVKTKNGIIAKVIDKDRKLYWFDRNVYKLYDLALDHIEIGKENKIIIKHSENILDLIEVGDVIKYKELRHFSNYETRFNEDYILGIHEEGELEAMKEEIKNKKIKLLAIITKEQLEKIAYKVEEE